MPLRLKSNVKPGRLEGLIAALPSHYELRGESFCLLTFSGDAVRASIADSYECPADMHSIDFWGCVRSATRNMFPQGPFNLFRFEEKLALALTDFRKTTPRRFVAWARINHRADASARFRFLGNDVRLYQDVPATLAKLWRDPSEHNSSISSDPGGGVISVQGQFRGADAAGYTLSDLLDRFVAFLNFWQNDPSGFTFPTGARAVFRLGPTFNLLDVEAKSYGDGYWTNPDFDKTFWSRGHDKSERFRHSMNRVKALQRHSATNPLFETAVRCMMLLNSGWTAREDQHGLMLVWSCFEKIFSTGADGTKGGYAAIARRAAKFDQASAVREAVLQTLASHRNDAAHANGRSGSSYLAREVVSECSQYLLWLIRWLVREGRRFRSRAEFLEWVDIPKERERLLQRRRLDNMALTYWHSPPDKSDRQPPASSSIATIVERQWSDGES